MGLEATMIILDTSEYGRNGDFAPTRLGAQQDAANLICQAKTEQNPESAVGVMTHTDVLVTLTQDVGKLMSAIAGVKVGAGSNFASALQVAQLALKHRQNKNQRQRVVVFVGSPVESETVESLTKLGKKLKKNSVAIDVVSFGNTEENEAKLAALVEAAQGPEPSHLVSVRGEGRILSDTLLSTAVIMGENAGAGGAGAAGGAGGWDSMDLGVDPNMDPELALALRISAEEARGNRQMDVSEPAAAQSGGGANAMDTSSSSSAAAPFLMDEDAALQAALQLSLAASEAAPSNASADASANSSSANAGGSGSANAGANAGDFATALQDPNYIQSLLAGLTGVTNDQQSVDRTIEELKKKEEEEKKKGKKEDHDDHLYD